MAGLSDDGSGVAYSLWLNIPILHIIMLYGILFARQSWSQRMAGA